MGKRIVENNDCWIERRRCIHALNSIKPFALVKNASHTMIRDKRNEMKSRQMDQRNEYENASVLIMDTQWRSERKEFDKAQSWMPKRQHILKTRLSTQYICAIKWNEVNETKLLHFDANGFFHFQASNTENSFQFVADFVLTLAIARDVKFIQWVQKTQMLLINLWLDS